jgi:hypothetical protein
MKQYFDVGNIQLGQDGRLSLNNEILTSLESNQKIAGGYGIDQDENADLNGMYCLGLNLFPSCDNTTNSGEVCTNRQCDNTKNGDDCRNNGQSGCSGSKNGQECSNKACK